MELTRAVGENIKRIRKSKKLSMERLAAESGVSRSMLGQIERGEANPSVAILGKLAKVLKVPAETLLENDDFQTLLLSRELDNKARVAQTHDLYEYWGTVLHDEVYRGETCVVNLASLEYSKAIRRHLKPGETFVTCVFGELEGQKVVQKGVYAKMARGEMVRYAADVDARAPEDLVGFDRLGYAFCPQRSKPEELVFVRGPQQR